MSRRPWPDAQDPTLDELQRLALQNLYLGSPNLAPIPPPTHQHSTAHFYAPSPPTFTLPFPLRAEPTGYNPYFPSPPDFSGTPSAPINFSPPHPSPSFDSNSFDNLFEGLDSLSYSSGNYTPSYGSWSSSFGEPSPSHTGSSNPGSVFSDHSSGDAYTPAPYAHQQHPAPAFPYHPSLYPSAYSYPMALDGQSNLAGGVGGRGEGTRGRDRAAVGSSGSSQWDGGIGGLDEDAQMSDARGSEGGSAVVKDAAPGGEQLEREQQRRHELERVQQQQQAGFPSASRPTISSRLSDSPPKSTTGFHPPPEGMRASPALSPLAIPSGPPTPSLNLTEPTPATARPRRRKGKGTLELERVFSTLVKGQEGGGLGANGDVQSSSEYRDVPQQDSRRSSQPTFAPHLATDLPYTFTSSPVSHLPPHPLPFFPSPAVPPSATSFLHLPPRKAPTRQRSKSETNMSDPIATAAPPAPPNHIPNHPQHPFPHVPSGIQGGHSQWGPLDAQDPNSAYRGSVASSLDLAGFNYTQHELAPRRRSNVQGIERKVAAGPGYAAGLMAPAGSAPPRGGHRRARSHGGSGSGRSSPSGTPEASSELAPTASQDGRLAPPASSARPAGPTASTSASGFAPPPPAGGGFAPPPPPGNYYATQSGPSSAQKRTPYVYHSPVAAPAQLPPPAPSPGATPAPDLARAVSYSGSVSGSEDGREVVTVESRTTPATIEAAQRRRNPGAAARFVCELCGETFTRRYNLRGHQRAHRNEKPFACSYEGCDKAFARAHDCKRHELLHLGVRRYHCDPCQRDFVRLDALQRHHRSEVGQACVNQLRDAGFVIGYSVEPSGDSGSGAEGGTSGTEAGAIL